MKSVFYIKDFPKYRQSGDKQTISAAIVYSLGSIRKKN